jgi:hypothetical protein
MAGESQSTAAVSSLLSSSPSNMTQQQWKHPLTKISQKLTGKLHLAAIFNILIGILSIGLDIGLLVNHTIT